MNADINEKQSTKRDALYHVTAASGRIRALAALTTHSVEEARRRHDLYPTAAAALGRTMTGTALMAAGLKGQEKLMVEIVGNGPLGRIVAEANAAVDVRGYVQYPHVHFPLNASGKLDVARAVGQGNFYVTKDLGLKEPYRGMVPLISGEIAEDFAYYLNVSEQTPSACILGVLVDPDNSVRAAGGLLIQLMPGARENEELVAKLEKGIQALPALSRAIDSGVHPLELLFQALDGFEARVVGEKPVAFRCICSKERFRRGLIALGAEELRDIIDTQGEAELVCHFCLERYQVKEDELRELIIQIENPPQ